jgi:hypothetical protein
LITGQTLGCFNETTWGLSGADCNLQTPSSKFAANADGGFDVLNAATNGLNGRMFAYRAGGGELTMVLVGSAGNFNFLTKQRTLSLPPVGRVITNVGPSIGQNLTIGGTNDHTETVTINTPRNGYTFRTAAAAVPATDNTTVNVLEFTALVLRVMGMNPVVLLAAKILVLSVNLL